MRLQILVVLVVLAVPAHAQAPEPTLSITSGSDTVVVSREADTTLRLTVTFQSENPLDQLSARQVRLSHSTTPDGWRISLDPQVLDVMGPDDSRQVTATITLGATARQSEAPVTFTARLVPRGQEGTPTFDPAAEDSVQVTLKRDDPRTREVLEGVGAWIWVILGALALLSVVLAIVLSRQSRAAVALRSDVRRAVVAPGRSVAVPLTVENLTRVEDTVVFHVAPVRPGWAAALPVPELPLDGRRREELHLVVTAPKDATVGSTQQVGVSAHSAQNPRRVAEWVVEVVVGDTEARRAAGDTTPADEME